VVHPDRLPLSAPLLATAPGGDAGREPLIPLHKQQAGKIPFQGIQCSQNLLRLESHLASERPWNPDDDLSHILFFDQAVQKRGELPTRHHLKGVGDHTPGIGDGDAGAYVPHIKGGDAPAAGPGQGLLPAGETLVQDLPHPGQGVGDGTEVTATSLGHGSTPSSSTAEHTRYLAHYLPSLDLL